MSTTCGYLHRLLNNAKDSDVQFTFKDSDVKYFAHKSILRIFSDVFDTMFFGGMDKTTTNEDVVEIIDIRPENFLQFLTFIYTDDVMITNANLIDIFNAAHKYKIDDLESVCTKFLTEKLNDDTVCAYLEQCFHFESLAEVCLRYIDDAIDDLLNNDKLYNLSEGAINLIIKRDSLVIRESKLFKFLIKWAEKFCENENEIASSPSTKTLKLKGQFFVFNMVRFPTMTIQEFDECVKFKPDFFTSEEIGIIYKYLSAGIQDDGLIYSTLPRVHKLFKLPKVQKFVSFHLTRRSIYQHKYEFEFNVKMPLDIQEFYVLVFNSFRTHITLSVNDGTDWAVLYKSFVQFKNVIRCDPQIRLLPTYQYKLKSTIQCNDQYCIRKEMCIYVPNEFFNFPTNLMTFIQTIAFEVQDMELDLKRKREN